MTPAGFCEPPLNHRGALMSADLIELVQRLGQPRVLVVGDLMLDRYIWGDAERISQEAPVILLRAERREERLGGGRRVGNMPGPPGGKGFVADAAGKDHHSGGIL